MIEVSCRVRRGSFRLDLDTRLGSRATGIFGRSGAGKSSLLHALAGLIPVEDLHLAIDGETVVDTRARLDSPPHRRRLGMVFQDHRLFPHLSIDANLRFGLVRDRQGPEAAGGRKASTRQRGSLPAGVSAGQNADHRAAERTYQKNPWAVSL